MEEDNDIKAKLKVSWENKDSPETKDKDSPETKEPFIKDKQSLHSAVRVSKESCLLILADHLYFYVINLGDRKFKPRRYE